MVMYQYLTHAQQEEKRIDQSQNYILRHEVRATLKQIIQLK